MKLSDSDILRLLPGHISGDPQFSATASAARPVLSVISQAIPNLLLWARLGGQSPETFLPPLRRLTEARGGLEPLDLETLESLAWQFHVDFREVAKTNTQLAELILKSIAWHRIKGTPKSMYDALILCGFDTRYSDGAQYADNGRMDAAMPRSGAKQTSHSLQAPQSVAQDAGPLGIYIEEGGPQVHWATYQLGFEEIADYEDLKNILKICWEMQPARCRLWRVYTFDYDLRPGCWSGPLPQNAWSNAWWSLWSGAYMPEFPGLDERGLLVSWGKRERILCEQWSANRRVIALQEKLRVLRVFGHVIPRWSEAYWSNFVFPKPPAFVVWNGHGLLIGEIIGGKVWQDCPWPQKDWGGKIRNLAGQFRIGNCGISAILVAPPDYWPVWPDENWLPDANWLYGHANGWQEKPWAARDWLHERRLLDPKPVTVLASDLVATVFDLSLQDAWPDAPWQDAMWMNLFCIGKKSLFQGGQLFAAQVGDSLWERNFWAEEAWPDRVWADSWRLAGTENIAGDFGAAISAIFTAAVFPADCYERWPNAAWQQKAWDDSFRQLKPELAIALEPCLGSVANSDAAQSTWPDLPWQAEVWFAPKTVGANTSFKIISEISPDAIWLATLWQPCAWRQMEDA